MNFEFSAGGVVYKPIRQAQGKKEFLILLCQHSQHHGWVFPKGLIGDQIENEGKEETALREVKEETGVDGRIIKPLSPVTYWYIWQDDPTTGSHSVSSGQAGQEKIKKTVYYFLMEYVSGDITKHDNEMENVEWLPPDEVERRLTYKADKEVWREALKNLQFSI